MLAKISEFQRRFAHANSWPLALFSAAILYGLVYRLRLINRLYQEEAAAYAGIPTVNLLQLLTQEILSALLLLAIAGMVWLIFRTNRLAPTKRILKWPGIILLHALIILVGVIYTFHINLVFTYRSGLTLDMIQATFAAGATKAMADEGNIADVFFAGLFLLIYWVNLFSPKRFARIRNIGILLVVILVCLLAIFLKPLPMDKVGEAAKSNPILYTLNDIGKTIRGMGSAELVAMPAVNQMNSVAFVDPEFTTTRPAERVLGSPLKQKPWNLVFIVLESTGAEYPFDTKYGNQMPMPFLKQLSDKSLHLLNHFTGSNTTPRSLFSIFTGLYADPRVQMFITRPDVRIPSIRQFLGPDYSSFFVYNGSLDWYFPQGFLRNAGMTLYGVENFPVKQWQPGPGNGRNESQLFDFFIEELDRCKQPCLATYHSYAAHWPYYDYGSAYDVFTSPAQKVHEWVRRYYNNLRLMDTLIERLVQHLKKTDRLDNTVLVFVGDHGQAFGKHADNWIHSRASYLENYQVPLVIYQPRLFPAQKIHRRTQHIDILPTLLETMGLPYNPRLIQGESIYKKQPGRKYDFLYGNEQTISSISRDDIMLQVSLKYNQCWVFDLNRDPGQMKKLGCENYNKQKQALLVYQKYQSQLLERYNDSYAKQQSFSNERHAFLR